MRNVVYVRFKRHMYPNRTKRCAFHLNLICQIARYIKCNIGSCYILINDRYGFFAVGDRTAVFTVLNIHDQFPYFCLVTYDSFMFAVGDGNHSIATAKLCWDSLKKTLSPEERANHPARFCLCELVNLYEEDLIFEPIHRVVFGVGQEFIDYMQNLEIMKKH